MGDSKLCMDGYQNKRRTNAAIQFQAAGLLLKQVPLFTWNFILPVLGYMTMALCMGVNE